MLSDRGSGLKCGHKFRTACNKLKYGKGFRQLLELRKKIVLGRQFQRNLLMTLEKVEFLITFLEWNEENMNAEVDKVYRINTRYTKLRKVPRCTFCKKEDKRPVLQHFHTKLRIINFDLT